MRICLDQPFEGWWTVGSLCCNPLGTRTFVSPRLSSTFRHVIALFSKVTISVANTNFVRLFLSACEPNFVYFFFGLFARNPWESTALGWYLVHNIGEKTVWSWWYFVVFESLRRTFIHFWQNRQKQQETNHCNPQKGVAPLNRDYLWTNNGRFFKCFLVVHFSMLSWTSLFLHRSWCVRHIVHRVPVVSGARPSPVNVLQWIATSISIREMIFTTDTTSMFRYWERQKKQFVELNRQW